MTTPAQAVLPSHIGWILAAILSVLWIAIGIFLGKKAKNLEGYMLAGRNVGLALGTGTAMATWVTSNTTMLAPQFAFELGIWGMLAYSTGAFGLILFAPLARRIKDLMPDGYTSGDFVRLRYGRPAWSIFLVISLFYGLTWLISMGMAGGILLEAVSGIEYRFGMSIILLVCVSYTLVGGLYAVIGTDFLQSIIILIGVVVVGVAILQKVEIAEIYANIENSRPMLLHAFFPAACIALFNNLLFGLGEVFHSNVWWSRAFAMRKDVGFKAYILAGVIWIPIPIAAGFIALASDALGINVTSPDMVGPLVAARVLGTAGAALVFVVIFCSLASSVDSLLAALSDLMVEDVYRKMINPQADEAQLRAASSKIVIGLGVVAWLSCLPRISTLATVLFFAGPLVASTIWPIACGLFWRRTPARAAVWGMLLGSLGGLYVYFSFAWYAASLAAAAISMITTLALSLKSESNFEWSMLSRRDNI
jgi:Na+/proline symporter